MKTIHKENRIHENFSFVSNEVSQNSSLSFGARGLLIYLLSLPDTWIIKAKAIEKQGGIGKHARLSLFKELENLGHLKLVRSGVGKGYGKLEGEVWMVFANPEEGRKFGGRKIRRSNNSPAEKSSSIERKENKKNKPRSLGSRRVIVSSDSVLNEKSLKYANKLLELLNKNGRIHRQVRIKDWANQFRLLNTKDKQKWAKINKVLKWYSSVIGQKYIPTLNNAKDFRNKWDKLVNAMNSTEAKAEVKTKLTPLGGTVTNTLNENTPFKGSTEGLREAVEVTLSNYSKWFSKASKIRDKWESQYQKQRDYEFENPTKDGFESDKQCRMRDDAFFAKALLERLQPPESFTVSHFDSVMRKHGWKNDFEFSAYAIRIDNKTFKEILEDATKQNGDSPKKLKRFLEEVNK